MKELEKYDISNIGEAMSQSKFIDRLYACLLEDCNFQIEYPLFVSMIRKNGIIKVLKALGLWKVTGARFSKKTFIHPKLQLIIDTTIASNEIIAKSIIKLVDNQYTNTNKFNIESIDEFLNLKEGTIENKTIGTYCTYIIKNPNDNSYKIGRSKNIKRRLYDLSSIFKTDLILVAYLGYDIEEQLHKRYFVRNKHLFGEWFSLNTDDILDLKNEFNFTIVELL